MKWLIVTWLSACLLAQVAWAQSRNLAVANTTHTAQKRVALVIGNADYKGAQLKNPINDATAITEKLRVLGFEVILRTNLTSRQIGAALREFKSNLSPGAVALFYYAGHGLQIKGENYLPAVDAEISTEEDVPNQSLSVKQVMGVLEDSKTRLNLVFLDACRDNPYARSTRSSGGGLAKLDAPSGTLISFSTRPGSVASDGSGKNGLYTEHLLMAMDQPNLPIEQALKQVVSNVKRSSNGKQEPWMEGSIEGDFYFLTTADRAPQLAAPAPAQNSPDPDTALWTEVKANGTKEYFNAYLSQFPRGKFAAIARVELTKLQTQSVAKPTATATPQVIAAAFTNSASVQTPPTEILDSEWKNLIEKVSDGAQRYAGGSIEDAVLEYLKWHPRWLPTLNQMAANREPRSQGDLALLYLRGWGVPKDTVAGLDLLKKAAEQGNLRAQANLGDMYFDGQLIPKDDAEAFRWFRRAAEQGFAGGQNGLGRAYLTGRGVKKDAAEAAKWYRLAAEQGHARAQSNLADMYFEGVGVPKDEGEAYRWYRKSAEQGYAGGQNGLGRALANGRGVPKDPLEAVKWYRLAADQGYDRSHSNMGQ